MRIATSAITQLVQPRIEQVPIFLPFNLKYRRNLDVFIAEVQGTISEFLVIVSTCYMVRRLSWYQLCSRPIDSLQIYLPRVMAWPLRRPANIISGELPKSHRRLHAEE